MTPAPPEALRMLANALTDSLGVGRCERHAFQQEVVDMIDEVLGGVENKLKGDLSIAEDGLQQAESEKAAKATAVKDAEKELTVRKEACVAAQSNLAGASAAIEHAESTLVAAVKKQKAGDLFLIAPYETKTRLEKVLVDSFEPISAGTAEKDAINGCVEALVKIGKEFEIDANLLNSFPSAALKRPESRGKFDAMVLQVVKDEITKQITRFSDELARLEPERLERENLVSAHTLLVKEARESEAKSKDDLEVARAAQRKAETDLRAARLTLEGLAPGLRSKAEKLDVAKADVKEHQIGVRASFEELAGKETKTVHAK
jgi:hypothetical protein